MKLNLLDFFNYHEVKSKKGLEPFIAKEYYIVSCDASYKKRIGSCSTQIVSNTKKYVIQSNSFNAIGPVESELKSILHGLRRIKISKLPNKILLTNDNYYAINFATGNFTPKKTNIKSVVDKILSELAQISQNIEFCLVRSKVNRTVDKAAKKELGIKQADCEKKILQRIDRIERAKKRADNLSYRKYDSHIHIYSKDKTYNVTLTPISCTCKYWTVEWSDKPLKTIKARALPCKHICKATDVVGKDIYKLFKRPICRLD